ncbi:hypothetical protein GCM10027448_11320 [Nocardioides dilutus]
MGHVGAAVVGEDFLDRHSSFGEPGDCAVEHGDRGDGEFVVMDLGIGDPGVVVDDRVHERSPDLGLAAGVLRAGAVTGGLPVPVALLFAGEAPAAAIGDVAELLDVDVDHRAGVRVLVAADRFTGDPVDVAEPVDPAADQDRVDRRWRQPDLVGDLHRTESLLPPQVHDLADHRLGRPVR